MNHTTIGTYCVYLMWQKVLLKKYFYYFWTYKGKVFCYNNRLFASCYKNRTKWIPNVGK